MTPREKVFRMHRILGLLYALLGLSFSVIVFLGSTSQNGDALLAITLLAIFGGIATIHFLIASACKAGKEGGRTASTIISCLMLLAVPIGTLIGIYLLANTSRAWSSQAPGT
jgi:cytochrome bd-type quinol oxidase subunit 2